MTKAININPSTSIAWSFDDETCKAFGYLNGRRIAELISWKDRASGHEGFTGEIVSPDGSIIEFMPSGGFGTPLNQIKMEIEKEILSLYGTPQPALTELSKESNDLTASPSPGLAGHIQDVQKVIRSILCVSGLDNEGKLQAVRGVLAELSPLPSDLDIPSLKKIPGGVQDDIPPAPSSKRSECFRFG